MERIQATLPALGTVSVDFHKESAEVLKMMGKKEFSRLRKVAHLGIVSSIFTGANHSREEYMLLQCAVVGLLAKLHKADENFALSASVKLNGIGTEVSSAEELLKIWALLGNYGHTKFTFGVERGFMRAALKDPTLFEWITKAKNISDIKKWCRRVIKDYRDEDMHYVISLARLQYLRERKYHHYLRNLLIPANELFPKNLTAQYKIIRLRDLFRRVRMLSMATLDSYYSHQPISVQLTSAILGLAEFTPPLGEASRFERILEETNSWLAEELYLHPRSCAATKSYEIKAEREILSRFATRKTPEKRREFLMTIIEQGMGIPDDKLLPLLRLKFEHHRLIEGQNLYDLSETLKTELAFAPKTYVAVNRNPFNDILYLDLLYRVNDYGIKDIATVYINLFKWLNKLLSQATARRAKKLLPSGVAAAVPAERYEALERMISNREIQDQTSNVFRIFNSFLSFIMPDGLKTKISEFVPKRKGDVPILLRFEYGQGKVFDQVTDVLKRQISKNPDSLSADRLNELKAINALASKSKAKFLLVCNSKFVIYDQFNRRSNKDEWDGIIFEIFDDEVRFTIVEAKNLATGVRSENQAYKQLDDTRKLFVNTLKGARYKRKKISKKGAYLRYYLPTARPVNAVQQNGNAGNIGNEE